MQEYSHTRILIVSSITSPKLQALSYQKMIHIDSETTPTSEKNGDLIELMMEYGRLHLIYQSLQKGYLRLIMKANTVKKIKLTQGRYALVDDEDFNWLNQWKWCFDRSNGYAHRNQWVNGKNRKKLDNRRKNLRVVTRSENVLNKGLQSNNTSGIPGVTLYKGKYWFVSLKRNRIAKWAGCFKDYDLAVQARINAERNWERNYGSRKTRQRSTTRGI